MASGSSSLDTSRKMRYASPINGQGSRIGSFPVRSWSGKRSACCGSKPSATLPPLPSRWSGCPRLRIAACYPGQSREAAIALAGVAITLPMLASRSLSDRSAGDGIRTSDNPSGIARINARNRWPGFRRWHVAGSGNPSVDRGAHSRMVGSILPINLEPRGYQYPFPRLARFAPYPTRCGIRRRWRTSMRSLRLLPYPRETRASDSMGRNRWPVLVFRALASVPVESTRFRAGLHPLRSRAYHSARVLP